MRYTEQKARVEYKHFIHVWQQAVKDNKGHAWVAERVGQTPTQVRHRAVWLRKHGIALAPMKHGIKKGYKYPKQAGHVVTDILVTLTVLAAIALWTVVLIRISRS